ncbi:MAG: cytochrome b/b6 domain-containing protein [Ancalomicrobiaceae bacterium]|nr:cytochrome b/b6 domain-containing protein [Ancalomicrobiaceae bacterium]
MWRDTRTGYGIVSILLHWGGAAVVIVVWVLGKRIGYHPSGPQWDAAENLHAAVATLALVIIVPRIVWRLLQPATPAVASNPPLLNLLAALVKWGLLLALTVMIVTGPLAIWSGPSAAIDLFGVSIPSPLPSSFAERYHHSIWPVHVLASKVVLALVALHVAGALKHLVVDRDGVFRRMLVPAKNEPSNGERRSRGTE